MTEDTGWPRNKAVRYGRKRVDDLLHGLWDRDGRRLSRQRSSNKQHAVWSIIDTYFCECGPEDYTLTISQLTATKVRRATKRVLGTSKKCRCAKQYVFNELNSDAVRIVLPQSVSVGDLVRVSWDPTASHCAACTRSQSVAMMRSTRAHFQRMIAQHPTYTAHKIQ